MGGYLMFDYFINNSKLQLVFDNDPGDYDKHEKEYELIHDLCIEYFQEKINIDWRDNNTLDIYPVTENWKLFIDRLQLELSN